MPSFDRIRELYQRFLHSTASEEELQELFDFSAQPEYEAEFKRLLSGSWDELAEVSQGLPEQQALPEQSEAGNNYGRIVKLQSGPQLPELNDEPEIKSRPESMLLIWLKSPVAIIAVFAVLLVALISTLKSNQQVALKPPVATPSDFAPGKQGAVLTLSDGRKITLDSIASGIVAMEGKTKLVKSAKGELVYPPDFSGNSESAVAMNTVSTPRGRHYKLVLPDGTLVWLNAGSSITYPVAFTDSMRKVEISGEAYLEVARHKQQGFLVTLNNFQIEVLGTHFNVSAYANEDQYRTTLTEGSIRISGGKIVKLLKAGQQAIVQAKAVENSSANIDVINDADIQQALAWKDGFFKFDNTDIKLVLRELERWYDVDVSYEGSINPHPIYGKMQRELYLSQVLNILKKLNVNYRIEGRKLIVSP